MMQTVEWAEFLRAAPAGRDEPVGLTIGVFDGVHLGHRLLLDRICAAKPALQAWVMTFRSSPDRLLHPRRHRGELNTPAQKLERLAGLGVDRTVIIDFSEDFGKLSGARFLETIRDRCRLSYLVVGEDFRCGYRAETDAAELRRLLQPFEVRTDIVAHERKGEGTISSTRIRSLISGGFMREAAVLLGYAYALDLRGLGDPAGARSMRKERLSQVAPKEGVYPVRMLCGGEWVNDRVTIEASMIRWNEGHAPVETIVFD